MVSATFCSTDGSSHRPVTRESHCRIVVPRASFTWQETKYFPM